MTFNEIIDGLNDLILDRESFIDKDDPDDMFTHDKAVLEETVKLLNSTRGIGLDAVPQCKKEVEDYKAQKLKRLAERIAEEGSANDTKYKSLFKQARILSVERRPEACLGCGFEHSCSIHGCAVINRLIQIAAEASDEHTSQREN